jgi:HEAT repeat protein
VAVSCSTPEEKKTPAQFINDNSSLLRQLASFVDSEQKEGIARIQRLGREQGSAVILYILGDKALDDYRIEVVLARILADWKDPRAIGYLLESLSVPDKGARSRASEGLLAFGDHPQVIDAMGEMLGRPVVADRLVAAETLKKVPSPRVVEMFLDRWKGETDAEVRAILLVKILSSRHPRRKGFLIDALTDPEMAIRAEAWKAIRKYPDLPGVDFSPDGALEERARAVAELRIWVKAGKK